MRQERFKADTSDCFFGDFLYEQVIPQDHFLMQLKHIVPWQRFSHELVQYYQGRAKRGRPPYDPGVVLKMLLLSYLYNISERQVEDLCNLYLPAKCFLGLGVDERPPDHSTLSAFKKRILENGKLVAFENLLQTVISLALEKGIEFGPIQVIDSTHSVADVNVSKDKRRQGKGKPARDGSARWGVKRSYKVGKGKKRTEKKVYFYGYKAHASLNAHNGLITSLVHTPGNVHDGHRLPRLLDKDLAQGLPVQIVAADRGYDDSENHCLLWSKDIDSAISLNDYRTQKKDPSKALWLQLQETEAYQEGRQERDKIEQVRRSQTAAWLGQVSLCWTTTLRHPELSDCHGPEPQTVGVVADRSVFQGPGQSLGLSPGGSASDQRGGTLQATSWQQTDATGSCGSP